MTTVERFFLALAVMTLVMLLMLAIVGQPPSHCRYLVPVTSKPGVYACSQYPHVKARP